jgi:hypothetical protein
MRSLRTFLVLGLLSLVAASGCLGADSTQPSPVTCIQDDCKPQAASDLSEQGRKELGLSLGSWVLQVDVAEGARSSHAKLALEGSYPGLSAENGQHCFEYSFAGPSGSADWSTGSCNSVGNVNVAVGVVPTDRDIGLFDESELAVGHHTFKVTWEPRQTNTLVWDVAVDY